MNKLRDSENNHAEINPILKIFSVVTFVIMFTVFGYLKISDYDAYNNPSGYSMLFVFLFLFLFLVSGILVTLIPFIARKETDENSIKFKDLRYVGFWINFYIYCAWNKVEYLYQTNRIYFSIIIICSISRAYV